MKRSRIVYGEACIHCDKAIDDDGVLYCSEDCSKGGREDVDQPGVQQAAAP